MTFRVIEKLNKVDTAIRFLRTATNNGEMPENEFLDSLFNHLQQLNDGNYAGEVVDLLKEEFPDEPRMALFLDIANVIYMGNWSIDQEDTAREIAERLSALPEFLDPLQEYLRWKYRFLACRNYLTGEGLLSMYDDMFAAAEHVPEPLRSQEKAILETYRDECELRAA